MNMSTEAKTVQAKIHRKFTENGDNVHDFIHDGSEAMRRYISSGNIDSTDAVDTYNYIIMGSKAYWAYLTLMNMVCAPFLFPTVFLLFPELKIE